MIYELLLVHKDAHKSYTRNLLPYVYHPINLNRWMLRIVPKYTRSWQPDYNLHPAILRTNSHVHAEASRILYGKNYFVWSASQPHRGNESLIFKHTNRLHREVPPYYLRLITRLLLIFDCGDPKSRGNPKTWSRAMELTVKETADTLKVQQVERAGRGSAYQHPCPPRLYLARRWFQRVRSGLQQHHNAAFKIARCQEGNCSVS